jgi:hypothetical protein
MEKHGELDRDENPAFCNGHKASTLFLHLQKIQRTGNMAFSIHVTHDGERSSFPYYIKTSRGPLQDSGTTLWVEPGKRYQYPVCLFRITWRVLTSIISIRWKSGQIINTQKLNTKSDFNWEHYTRYIHKQFFSAIPYDKEMRCTIIFIHQILTLNTLYALQETDRQHNTSEKRNKSLKIPTW